MKQLGYLLAVIAVMGMAFWAYRENYRTQTRIGEMSRVRGEIATLRERLGLLRAEWAWLNRPERLRELVDLNFERLLLVPLTPEQFIAIPQIAWPDPADAPPRPEADAPPRPEAGAEDVLTGAGEPLPGTPAGAVVPRPPSRPKGE